MNYYHTYVSKTFDAERDAVQLCSALLPFAAVEVQPVLGGFVVTCGLGDEDELAMLEAAEQDWHRREKE